MQATVVSIGNELLDGKTTNTNLVFLSKVLKESGFVVSQSLTLRDSSESIKRALDYIDDDWVFFTGGLGPTRDDLTKESVCEYFDLTLELHHESLTRIKNYFANLGREMAESNVKQAYFPKEALIIPNHLGSAPGMILPIENKHIILLPGPPSELKPMFGYIKNYINQQETLEDYESGYRVVGIGESDLETDLQDFYDEHHDVSIASYPGLAEIEYVFISKDKDKLAKALNAFRERYGKYIIGPHTQTLEERLVEVLKTQEKTISFAESCSAGLASARLVNVAGSSDVFNESYVLYSNQAKIKQLGVNNLIIEKFGAVSDQCVYELAYQLAQRTGADITLSISGIAGPTGGTALKPIGTMYFGVTHEGKTKTYSKVFSGDRDMVRQKAVTYGLYLVLKRLLHEDI